VFFQKIMYRLSNSGNDLFHICLLSSYYCHIPSLPNQVVCILGFLIILFINSLSIFDYLRLVCDDLVNISYSSQVDSSSIYPE